MISITILYYNIALYHNLMGPPSYMRSALDRKVFMRRIPVREWKRPGLRHSMSVSFMEDLQGARNVHGGVMWIL